MLWMLLTLACSNEVTVGYETLPCEDWDFDEGEERFDVEQSADEISIGRYGVIRGCDDEFEPQIEGDDTTVRITEAWTSTGDDCEVCYTPTVRIYDARRGEYEIYWFDESSNVTPVWSETFDVEGG